MMTRQKGVRKFLDERVKVAPLGIVPKEVLYTKYHEYCQTHNHIPYTKGSFSKVLKQRVFDIATTRRTIDGSRTWCWAGIRLKEEASG